MQTVTINQQTKKHGSVFDIVREAEIAKQVVFVGGLPGCGKSLFTAVVGSMDRVEIQKYNYTIEHLCSLYFLERIDEDVAIAMIRMQVDMDLYNLMMSRETNFRFKDLSSVFKNPRPIRYIRRLFNAGDEETISRIERERPVLHLLVHHAMMHAVPLSKALGDRFRMIQLVRHPLYMLKQWYIYINDYGHGIDPRDFDLGFSYQKKVLPFFAKGWEDLYLRSNAMDQSIYGIEYSLKFAEQAYQQLNEGEKEKVVTIPFEKFVKDEKPYIKQIETLLKTHATKSTAKELKKQNVPRKMIADGVAQPIYKKYGWESPEKGASERSELKKRRDFVVQHASEEGLKALDRLSQQYESRWGPF